MHSLNRIYEKIEFLKCFDLLLHSSECVSDCDFFCKKMKLIIEHWQKCCQKSNRMGCPVCNQILILINYHAHKDRTLHCQVLFFVCL